MKHRTPTLAILLAIVSSALACAGLAVSTGHAQRRRAPRRAAAQRAPRVDYTRFSHATAQHRKACDSCHQSPTDNWAAARDKDSAFPDVTDYPEHASCLNCHRRQFFSGARPAICAVCHTQVSPRSGARFPFENPSENFVKSEKARNRRSDFYVRFPHDAHLEVMARAEPTRGPSRAFEFARTAFAPRADDKPRLDSCSLCHQTYQPAGNSPDEYVTKPAAALAENSLHIEAFWLKRGMLKTVPASHASCFNCHWQDGGERPLSNQCNECHQMKTQAVGVTQTDASKKDAAASKKDADTSNPSVRGITDSEVLSRWSTRLVARFRHEKDDHIKVGCTTCHVSITAENKATAEAAFVPIKTCASSSCHGSTSKSAGAKRIILNEIEEKKKDASYSCAKCHINLGKEPPPKSHTDLFAK
jgi:hypothetical protein